jgi:hypothetical protein
MENLKNIIFVLNQVNPGVFTEVIYEASMCLPTETGADPQTSENINSKGA